MIIDANNVSFSQRQTFHSLFGLADTSPRQNTQALVIKQATSFSDFFHARQLLQAYAQIMAVDLELDGFSTELQRLPTTYRLPHGELLVATKGDHYVGCVGWRRFTAFSAKCATSDTRIAEVKRMFVQPEYNGYGIGRNLLEQLIESVREHGFNVLRLEVLKVSTAAIALYRKLGFNEIEHYRHTPLGDADYLSMQLDLSDK